MKMARKVWEGLKLPKSELSLWPRDDGVDSENSENSEKNEKKVCLLQCL